jgi:hypothetical protein
MFKNLLYLIYESFWRGSYTDKYYSVFLMEDGLCMTFNQISADLIFRNDTLDPMFLHQNSKGSPMMEPQSWSIETGYTSDGMQFYPLKSLTAESGFEVDIGTGYRLEDFHMDIDRHCRLNPEYMKIALHHPAEFALKTSFIKMPFNKSVSMMVKPKITTTSDSLRSYDPEV